MLGAMMALIVVLLTSAANGQQCVKIQSGLITDSTGGVITTGYDKWGYNYQAHMFNGFYENFSRPAVPVTTGNVKLIMKWSDDWLSNTDCNGNGRLDRGGASGANANISKGWLTNHEEGDYELNGETYHYTYFVKIVYDGGTACGAANPSCIWGSYTIIEEVLNDSGGGHGVDRSRIKNPAGLGYYTN